MPTLRHYDVYERAMMKMGDCRKQSRKRRGMYSPTQVAERVVRQVASRDIDQNVKRALETVINTAAQQVSSLKTDWERQQFNMLCVRAFDVQQRIIEEERIQTAGA